MMGRLPGLVYTWRKTCEVTMAAVLRPWLQKLGEGLGLGTKDGLCFDGHFKGHGMDGTSGLPWTRDLYIYVIPPTLTDSNR